MVTERINTAYNENVNVERNFFIDDTPPPTVLTSFVNIRTKKTPFIVTF
jgi:hypothetical protein